MMLRAYLPGGDSALPDSKVLFHVSQAEARLRAGASVIAVHGPVGQEFDKSGVGVRRSRGAARKPGRGDQDRPRDRSHSLQPTTGRNAGPIGS